VNADTAHRPILATGRPRAWQPPVSTVEGLPSPTAWTRTRPTKVRWGGP